MCLNHSTACFCMFQSKLLKWAFFECGFTSLFALKKEAFEDQSRKRVNVSAISSLLIIHSKVAFSVKGQTDYHYTGLYVLCSLTPNSKAVLS